MVRFATITNLTRALAAPYPAALALTNPTSLTFPLQTSEGVPLIPTITFGVLATVIGIGGLVMGYKQYVRGRPRARDVESALQGEEHELVERVEQIQAPVHHHEEGQEPADGSEKGHEHVETEFV